MEATEAREKTYVVHNDRIKEIEKLIDEACKQGKSYIKLSVHKETEDYSLAIYTYFKELGYRSSYETITEKESLEITDCILTIYWHSPTY